MGSTFPRMPESPRQADVVILTAIPLEYQQALKVDAGAVPGSAWVEEKGPNGLPVAFRAFTRKEGRPLRVAVALAGDMGAVAATNALLPAVSDYKPRCVAMSGVCAGRPGKTNLGDVVAAERLFFHDTGKKRPKKIEQDLKTYILRDDWKVKLESFDFASRFREEDWWKRRPIPYEWQENWVLLKLAQGVEDPSTLPESAEFCSQWEKVIEALWKAGHVERGTLKLTDKGRKRIGPVMIKHRQRLPDLSPEGKALPFKVHVAPMSSGSQVVEDKRVWSFISEYMRKTLGLEMEAAALGALVHAQRDLKLDVLVMKGVMDFANHGRDDQFKKFAARASAECLIAFLRENLEVEVTPGVDDLLLSGTEGELPENPPPSALLNTRYEVVPFHTGGREKVLAELRRWCGSETPVAVRLLHAAGGSGKTRLAIEWIRRLRKEGWAAGFLAKEVPENWFDRLLSRGQPVLVVIDYAESRSEELRKVLLRIHRYAVQEGTGAMHRVRVLLLARGAGDWWASLLKASSELEAWLRTSPQYELEPLAEREADREQVFHEAAERFARRQGKKYERRALSALSDKRFERVLYLHMAALAAIEGLTFEARTLMEVILDHEERFWAAGIWQSDARQLVAAATLRGGLATRELARSVAQRVLGRPASDESEKLLKRLSQVYQRPGNASSGYLPALEPDLLGEGMVLRVAGQPARGEDTLPPNWIGRVLPADEEPGVVKNALEILGRASAREPEAARPWIREILAGPLRPRAHLALQAALAVGQHTALSMLGDELAERLEAVGDVELARELEAIGIPDSTVSLRRVAEWTTRTLLKALPATDEQEGRAERARLLNNLGVMLSDLGRREEALKATQQAAEAYGALVQRNPEDFQPGLARSLSNLGNRLNELGRREEALKAAQQAVETYGALAQRNPEAFLPDLAASLNNLGNRLSGLGRREEALKATQQAVEMYGVLAQHDPEVFQPDLAMSLNNLGVRLSELGHREEALKATQQGVEMYGVLVQHSPDTFQPDLAKSLNILGVILSGLGRREEALKAAQQAVETYGALAQRNPEAFQSDLAASLNNLGASLRELGRREEALKAMQQAVETYGALAQRDLEAFQPNLAASLNNLGIMLSEVGLREEALAIYEEAISKLRSFFERSPNAFEQHMARLLTNTQDLCEALQRPLSPSVQECLDLYNRLTKH
jgi:tetratricopeptide (TPR) repeat protein/nucleoside phosphorylase